MVKMMDWRDVELESLDHHEQLIEDEGCTPKPPECQQIPLINFGEAGPTAALQLGPQNE